MSWIERQLNDQGIAKFSEYLAGSATGPAPLELTSNPETSEPLPSPIPFSQTDFSTRFELGKFLVASLNAYDAAKISSDRKLWTTLALLLFDKICPKDASGSRKVMEEYRYILSTDYRHYYRHLVRSPWQLVKTHDDNARILLVAASPNAHPLSVHGEILEQFGGRQQVLGSRPIVAAACKLYLDPSSGRPKKGVAGSKGGSARRFGIVLRQFDMTYDPADMPEDQLISILPSEFDRWRMPAE